jgi:competence protein ComEA
VRGQSDRVAARVRELLTEFGENLPPEPAPSPAPGPVPAGPAPAPRWRQWLTRVPVRVDPGRGGAVAVGVAVVAAAAVTGLWLVTHRPHAVPVAARGGQLSSAPTPIGTGGAVETSPATPSAPTSTVAVLVVDVAGKVRHPGLYRLPDGARVDDAVRAAGGALHGVDLSSLNLAARVVDGQQILVGGLATGGGAAPPGGAGLTTASTAPVSLNSATLEQLDELPGIGPVLAQNIIDWRTANGGFASIDQLTEVSGIGDVTFAELQPLVTL